ncbi:sulfate transporter family-domain-containing protein [Obelidium mucronatum]|nr:sulfate transporter family-domain-containing protein [Obelidium mucronatum]
MSHHTHQITTSNRSQLLAAAIGHHVPKPSFPAAENLFLFVKEAVHSTLTQAPVFPLVSQIKAKGYNLKTFRSDLIGSVTITLIMLPQAIAYASLTHLPTINCLVSAVFPVLIYAIFGGAPQLSMGPEATISTIVGAVVTLQMERNPDLTAVQIVTSLSFLIGLLLIGLSLLQAGFLDHILSGYLQTGFILGAACLIITEQLPNVLGLSIKTKQDESTILQFIDVCRGLWTAHWQTILLSASNILFLLFLKNMKKKYGSKYVVLKFMPEYLVLAIVMIAISAAANIKQHGIAILGEFDNTIPAPTVPILTGDLLGNMFESAITVLLVGYIECMTVTRNFGLRNGYVPSGNRELFAIGFTNLAGSFFGCYPVFASLPRSRILVNCGARTTLSNAMAGVFILIAFVALKTVFQYIPKAMLSSIIVVSALGLIETDRILFVFTTRAYTEIFMLIATFVITLATSLSTGILLCLGLSALLIVRKTTTSNISIMGRLPRVLPAPPPPPPPPTPFIGSSNDNQPLWKGFNQLTNSPEILDQPASPNVGGGSGGTTQQQQPSLHHDHHHHPHRHYVSVTEHPDALLLDNVLILRVDVPLMFYNCAQVRRSLETVMSVEKKLLLMARRRRNRVAAAAAATAAAASTSIDISDEQANGRWLVATDNEPRECDDTLEDVAVVQEDSENEDGEKEEGTPSPQGGGGSYTWMIPYIRKRESLNKNASKQGGDIALNVVSTNIADRIAKSRLRTTSIGIGMFGSSGDIPVDPSALTHSSIHPLSGDSEVARLKQGHNSSSLIQRRREQRRKDGSIHTIIIDLKHCIEMDTAAAQVLQEILSTFLYDGIELYLTGVHANHVILLKRADVHNLIMQYCLFFDDLEAAVDEAEKVR